MTNTIRLKRGTRSSIDLLASKQGLVQAEPLFITDENKLAVATSTSTYSTAVMQNNVASFATKGAPTAYVSDYITSYSKAYGEGQDLDASTSANGITILTDGVYSIRAVHRGTGADAYIAIALNGDLDALRNRTEGMHSHSHSGYNNSFAESLYTGRLYAGEFITVGTTSAYATALQYGALTTYGSLHVQKIG